MRKIYLTLPAMTLMVFGLLSWSQITESNSADPGISRHQEACNEPGVGNTACCLDYNAAIDAAEADWAVNLQQLIEQEKPASKMVDEAYENLRTYNCWLEYICRSVQYSGFAPAEASESGGLKKKQIGQAPGCVPPQDLHMGENYNTFVDAIRNEFYAAAYPTNKINYFHSCQSDKPGNNQNPSLIAANENFAQCKKAIDRKFGCDPEELDDGETMQECLEKSSALGIMETALKKTQADQKASALERKIHSINGKLHGMDQNIGYFTNFLYQLDQRLPCLAEKCT